MVWSCDEEGGRSCIERSNSVLGRRSKEKRYVGENMLQASGGKGMKVGLSIKNTLC